MNKYVAYLKKQESFSMDKYVLLLLSLPNATILGVAEALEVTRQTVYDAVKRNQDLFDSVVRTNEKPDKG